MTRTDGPILCFGELLLRLSPPGHGPLFRESRLDANFGGAEANVAVALARLGRSSGVISAVPDDVVGDAAIDALRRSGVDVSRIARSDGRLGLYYLAPGAGLRASAIVYDRQNSVFATRAATAYDWPALLAGAARLHLSGINPAIGSAMADICLAAMTAARDRRTGVVRRQLPREHVGEMVCGPSRDPSSARRPCRFVVRQSPRHRIAAAASAGW
ncbi:PfkB family carbohydrate kinase [Sphingomonas sp. LR55]|uniref:PfkB family carbohydrate kinase n=1 Tax=Sphingomonas sp. LR55 TaxID=3050231 RepID=UPI002FE21B5B